MPSWYYWSPLAAFHWCQLHRLWPPSFSKWSDRIPRLSAWVARWAVGSEMSSDGSSCLGSPSGCSLWLHGFLAVLGFCLVWSRLVGAAAGCRAFEEPVAISSLLNSVCCAWMGSEKPTCRQLLLSESRPSLLCCCLAYTYCRSCWFGRTGNCHESESLHLLFDSHSIC